MEEGVEIGKTVTSLHRPLGHKDKELMDEASRDIWHACRSALMLVAQARARVGLGPLPPVM